MTTVEPRQIAEKSVVIREQSQPVYIEGYHRSSYRDPDDAVYTQSATSCRMGAFRVSIARWLKINRLRLTQRGSAATPREVSGLFSFYALPVPGHTPAEMRERDSQEIEKLKTADVERRGAADVQDAYACRPLRGLANNQGLASSLAEYQTRYGDWRELFLQLDRWTKSPRRIFAGLPTRCLWIPTVLLRRLIPRPRGTADASKMEGRNEQSSLESCRKLSSRRMGCPFFRRISVERVG